MHTFLLLICVFYEEVRRPKSEDRRRKSEVGSRKSEVKKHRAWSEERGSFGREHMSHDVGSWEFSDFGLRTSDFGLFHS
jgi:hypothetical protein